MFGVVDVRHIRGLAIPSSAFASALLGRMSDAASRLAECDAIQVGTIPIVTLARSVLAARAGHWTEVREFLTCPAINQLGGCYHGLAEALKIWATEQLSNQVHLGNFDRVELFGESSPDAFKVIWPEFHEFLGRHGLRQSTEKLGYAHEMGARQNCEKFSCGGPVGGRTRFPEVFESVTD